MNPIPVDIDGLLALPELQAHKVDSNIAGTVTYSLHRLRLAYWGKRAPEGTEWDLTRPNLMKWSKGKLVVFDDYPRLLEGIDEARQECVSSPVAAQGVLITGSPGIGKTSSLWYLLVCHLCRAQPTVFYFDDKLYVFTASGLWLLKSSEALQTELFDDVVCLVDMDWERAPGPGALRNSVLSKYNRGFVVGASSPNTDRYHLWTTQASILTFVLEAPSKNELMNLCRLTDIKFEESDYLRRVRPLLNVFGPNLRKLMPALLQHDPKKEYSLINLHIARIISHIQGLPTTELFRLFQQPDQVSNAFSHTLIHTYRSPSSAKFDHLPRHRIRSPLILRLVLKASQFDKLARMRYMSDLFTASSSLAVSRGWVFECLCHAKICAMDTLSLLPMTRKGNKLTRNSEGSPLNIPIGERRLVLYTSHSTVQSTADLEAYYVPAEGNNATFDAFIHGSPGNSLGFQMFVAKSHDVKKKGMTSLRKWLKYDAARDWKATPIKFIFVVPQDSDVVVELPGPGYAFTDIEFFVLEMQITEHEKFVQEEEGDDSDDEMDTT
ncbi:hypothetical protein B0H16DRAFT_1560710 [Mycena metata]|uniref:Uncharacterized protein n=1 Tax=Mycena metata TaxID=1033252 RepID=A0AAD7IIJ6_9AGAR|nr:hypothetical protein B0H16DRAFT_1560710 [Mycena metata]